MSAAKTVHEVHQSETSHPAIVRGSQWLWEPETQCPCNSLSNVAVTYHLISIVKRCVRATGAVCWHNPWERSEENKRKSFIQKQRRKLASWTWAGPWSWQLKQSPYTVGVLPPMPTERWGVELSTHGLVHLDPVLSCMPQQSQDVWYRNTAGSRGGTSPILFWHWCSTPLEGKTHLTSKPNAPPTV